MLKEIIEPDFLPTEPAARLLDIKEVMHVVACRVKDWVYEKGARSIEEKLACMLSVLRGARGGDLRRISKGLKGFPDLRRYLDPQEKWWTDRAGFDALFADLMRQNLLAREASARNDPAVPNGDARTAQYLARVRRMSLAWKKTGRQLFLRQVSDADGIAHSGPNDCSRLLAEHWSKVFQLREADGEMIADLVSSVIPIPLGDVQFVSKSGSPTAGQSLLVSEIQRETKLLHSLKVHENVLAQMHEGLLQTFQQSAARRQM